MERREDLFAIFLLVSVFFEKKMFFRLRGISVCNYTLGSGKGKHLKATFLAWREPGVNIAV